MTKLVSRSIAALLVLCIIALLIAIRPSSTSSSNVVSINYELTATVTFWKGDKVIYRYAGLDPLTNLGMNLTFAKLTGNPSYNLTTYNLNCSFVSIGIGVPDATSIILPGEWARANGTQHSLVYNGFNITGTITPPVGPNSANCIGINYDSPALGANDLYCYTTFSTVNGIDDTFTIIVELQVRGTTS